MTKPLFYKNNGRCKKVIELSFPIRKSTASQIMGHLLSIKKDGSFIGFKGEGAKKRTVGGGGGQYMLRFTHQINKRQLI